MNGRAIEVAIRKQTEGEAWVQDVENTVKGMLSKEAASDTTGPAESAEIKELRQKIVDNAKIEFADGKPPENPAGPGGRGGGRGRGGDDGESYGNFGGGGGDRDGGGSRACYNCGKEGHISRDCPEPRQDNRGGGDGGGGSRACYNCGQEGHQSRDCPEPRQDNRGGGGGGYRDDRGGGGGGGGERFGGGGGGGGGW
jgi:hypothetical protein